MAKVLTEQSGLIEVPGGKFIEIKGDVKGFVEGQTVVAFRNDNLCDFTVSYPEDHKGVKHVPEGTTIVMHVLDAAIAQSLGKGKITKVHQLKDRPGVALT